MHAKRCSMQCSAVRAAEMPASLPHQASGIRREERDMHAMRCSIIHLIAFQHRLSSSFFATPAGLDLLLHYYCSIIFFSSTTTYTFHLNSCTFSCFFGKRPREQLASNASVHCTVHIYVHCTASKIQIQARRCAQCTAPSLHRSCSLPESLIPSTCHAILQCRIMSGMSEAFGLFA